MLSCLQILFYSATLALSGPLSENFLPPDWEPEFTDAAVISLRQDTVALVTHSSSHFDPLRRTAVGVNRMVATMKQQRLPVLYLHDRHNPANPAWMYLYDDWKPTAYIQSDIGHFELDFRNVRHVICAGGYFTLCQNNTVADSVSNWQRDGGNQNLRITQVVDGIFDLGDGVRDNDPYRSAMRKLLYDELKSGHPDAVMSLEDLLRLIGHKEQAVDYLRRRLPPLPAEIDVSIDFFGIHSVVQEATFTAAKKSISKKSTTSASTVEHPVPDPPRPPRMLTFAYRTSADFLTVGETEADE